MARVLGTARSVWTLVRDAARNFARDEALTLAASLAFYMALSFAPLTLLLIRLGSALGPRAEEELVSQVVDLLGSEAGAVVETIIENAESNPDEGALAGVLGIGVLVFSATSVFAQLQTALNHVWDVRAKPGNGVWSWLRKRLLSAGMLGAVGLLLLVSLALSTVLSLLASAAADRLPGADAVWVVLNTVVSLALFAAVFAAVFRFLPDARIAWRDVVFGALVTAVLFSIGKLLIGAYLGRQAVGSAYGAAGSLLVLLVWVYYSATLVFFGAELTQSFAARRGRSILPDRHAVRESLARARDPEERALVRDAIEAHREAARGVENPS